MMSGSHPEAGAWYRTVRTRAVLASAGQAPAAPLPQTVASVQPRAANSSARSGASSAQKNSSSCGGWTEVPLSMACAWPR
jgi:hypothetical protein